MAPGAGLDQLLATGLVARGKVAYHAAADQRSWAHMKLFFEELFAR